MIEQKFSQLKSKDGIKVNISNRHSYIHYERKYRLKPSNPNDIEKLITKARQLEMFRLELKDKSAKGHYTPGDISKELKTKTEFTTAYNSLLIDLFGNKDNISFADYNIYIQYNESLHEYEILLIIGDYNAQVIAHYIEPKIKTFPGYIRAQS